MALATGKMRRSNVEMVVRAMREVRDVGSADPVGKELKAYWELTVNALAEHLLSNIPTLNVTKFKAACGLVEQPQQAEEAKVVNE